MEKTIKQILDIEWKMFQKVNSLGGRAACQNDPETFFIMRQSQYENWTDKMNLFYLDFLTESEKKGRNLVAEKYGRMMRFTDPLYYQKNIAPFLPVVPLENFRRIEHIVKILIRWEIRFAQDYPLLAKAGRPITSDGDLSGFTSLETYARGELETYPARLLSLYSDYVDTLLSQGRSLSVMMQETTVRLYGYASIEEAEKSLSEPEV